MSEPDEYADSQAPTAGRRRRAVQRVDADRLPPHSIEAEQGVLGCCLLDPSACMGVLAERVKGHAQVFYDLKHQTIFNVLREMYDVGMAIDLITVIEQLRKRGALAAVGDAAYLSELEDKVPSAANLPTYLEIVKQKYLQRRMIGICTDAVGKIYDCEGDPEKLLLETEAEMSKLTESETPAQEEHVKVVMGRVVQDMEAWYYMRGSQQLRGLPTGPAGGYLDKILQGIRDTDYVVLAGRPGGGKSSLAMNIVEYLGRDYVWYEATGRKVVNGEGVKVDETVQRQGIPIAVFSLEMNNESLGYRLVFGRAGVDMAQWNQGFAKAGDKERLTQAISELAGMNIYLDDATGQTINQIAAKARRMVRQYGIKLFVLDYLQLCEADNPRDDERITLKKISKKIVALKKQLKVPWLVIAQMNRNIEMSERDRPPMLSDLAGSGSIENDADKVIILKKTPRKEVEAEGEGDAPSDKEIMDLVCADWEWSRRPRRVDAHVVKNRHGPTGKAEMLFQNNLCRFYDWHLWKVEHGVEDRKAGESKRLAPVMTDEEAEQCRALTQTEL